MPMPQTFSQWLEDQAGRPDMVGQVGIVWRDAKGERPRASAYVTVREWLESNAGFDPAEVAAAMQQAHREYQAARIGQQASPAPDGAEPGGQPQQASPPAGSVQVQIPAAQLPLVAAIVQGVWNALDERLTRLQDIATLQARDLSALVEWARRHDEEIKPLRAFLDELASGEALADEADQAAADGDQERAAQLAGLPPVGPDAMPAGGLWQAYQAVPEPPDMQRLHDLGEAAPEPPE